jgi:Mg-chelatase subunit ChlD
MDIMQDPVLMSDGHTYERTAIAQALVINPVSPITRQPMSMSGARPNYAVKSLIDRWNQKSVSHSPQSQSPVSIESGHHIQLSNFSAKYFTNPDDPVNDYLHISIEPKSVTTRLPLVLISMIDVSGSMEMNVCESGRGLEDVDLSRLQLVQHALKTIVETLDECDEVEFITFSNRATLTLPPTRLTDSGRQRARTAIDGMTPNGATNIWDALRLGLEEAKRFKGWHVNTMMLLFTDGEPNQNPPMGILPTLTEALSGMAMEFSISTFGFGYNIDSELLTGIAKLGHGIYGYCPDCSMVGTVFINYMASAMATVCQHAMLSVRNPKCDFRYDLTFVDGSSRNILVEIPHDVINETQLTLTIPNTGDRITHNHIEVSTTNADHEAIHNQIYRYKFMDLIDSCLSSDLSQAARKVQSLFDEIQQIHNPSDFVKALALDLIDPHPNHGQVAKAVEPAYFRKWGNDYLRSLSLCHAAEQCGNFKDASLQFYGGSNVATYRTFANKKFVAIPPPVSRVSSWRRVDMNYFYNSVGACFNGDAMVALAIGEKRVRDMVKGDQLFDGGIVECLVETVEKECICEAVIINNVAFTPYHPIHVNGKWVFPIDVGDVIHMSIDSWFNLVLKGNKIVRLNGIEAITLGHHMTQDCLGHPYFGTNAVIQDLQRSEGYSRGHVRRLPMGVIRDRNGMIIGTF